MTWALKRQFLYLFILILIFGGLGFWIGRPYFNKPPTCFDGKQNADEVGVDCGGSCSLACSFEVDEVSVYWSRAFRVVPGRYNAVAYMENKNENTVVKKISYRFRFADKDNVYIGKREGEAFIPPAGKFAIFEPAVDMGNSVPVYTTFEFTEQPVWQKIEEDKASQINLYISNINLEDSISPSLSAVIKNNSFFMIPEVSVVAVLYDIEGNAITSSRTYVNDLRGGESVPVNFTWIEPFEENVVSRELIPVFDITEASLK